jgi:DNA-binding transcriptional ArsR family regulator
MKRAASKVKAKSEPADPMIAASEEAAGLLKAMASPVRLRILCLLAENELPVGRIAERLQIREQATSQQLAQLRLEGLIVARKEAQRVFYRLASKEIERLLGTLRDIYCPD